MGRALLHLFLLGLAAVLLYLALSHTDRVITYVTLMRAREEQAINPDAIHIAIIWPSDGSNPQSLMKGAELAAAEVNKNRIELKLDEAGEPWLNGMKVNHPKKENGKFYCDGIPLTIPSVGDRKSEIKCVQIELTAIDTTTDEEADKARELSTDPRFVAVIGHSSSDISKLASVRYQFTQLVFFAVNATDPSFTTHGFGFAFRNVPTDNDIAEALSKTLDPFGQDTIGILYSHSGHSRDVRSSHMVSAVDTFKAAGLRRQPRLDITLQKSYGSVLSPPAEESTTSYLKSFLFSRDERFYERHQTELREAINVAQQAKVSAFLILDDQAKRASEVLRRIRAEGANQVVLGVPTLDAPDFFPGADKPKARVLRLPAATARVTYRSMSLPEKLSYIRDRARELNYVFADDFGDPISIAPEVAPRVIGLILKQLETARLGPKQDLGFALSRADAYAPSIMQVFKAQGVPPALGTYLSVLEPTLARCSLPSPPSSPAPKPASQEDKPRSFNPKPTDSDARAPGTPKPSDWCDPAKLNDAVTTAAGFMKRLRTKDFSGETQAASTLLALLSYKYGPEQYRALIEDLKKPQSRPGEKAPRLLTPQEREQEIWARLAPAKTQAGENNLDREEFLWRFFAAAIIGENPADFGVPLRALSFEGLQAKTTYVASVFSPDLNIKSVRDFVNSYKKRNNGDEPDFIASQGYEAVKILAQVYTRKGSIVPTEVSVALRLLGDFDGLTGKVSFAENGDIRKKTIFLKAYANQ